MTVINTVSAWLCIREASFQLQLPGGLFYSVYLDYFQSGDDSGHIDVISP